MLFRVGAATQKLPITFLLAWPNQTANLSSHLQLFVLPHHHNEPRLVGYTSYLNYYKRRTFLTLTASSEDVF
jgi:hypothetical protein